MKLHKILVYAFCVMVAGLFSTAAAADRRVALVIGNSAYKSAPSLSNTINDSIGIANLFKSVGFEVVISRTDLGVVDFKRAVREFLITAEKSDVAVVYYAGHGIEIGGTNYLVPIDAKLGRDYDVEDEAVALDRIIWALQSVRRLRLILLDACRDNPFPQRVRSAGVRSTVKGGLGTIEDVSADTLVAYAAKAGSVSYDGDGRNSPYATSLIKHLAEPGLDIRIALGRVRDDVIAVTGGRQEPFIYGSLGGATIALVPAPKVAEPVTAPSSAAKPTAVAPMLIPPIPPTVVPNAAPPVAVAKVEPPSKTPPSVARDAADPALACIHDEMLLAQLRAEPSRDRIISFQKELSCPRLAAQVQRLLESVSSDPPPPQRQASPAGGLSRVPPAQMQAQAGDVCARDAARLARLRQDPKPDTIAKFMRELGCEQIRPQLQRLRESLGM